VDEGVRSGEPVGHERREALDPDTLLPGEAMLQPSAQRLVAATETDDEPDVVEPQRNLHRRVEPPDTPPAAGDDDDPRPGRQSQARARVFHRPRLLERPVGEAGDPMHPGRGAGDRTHLLDRLAVRDEVYVSARRRPVPERCEVGDRGADGYVEA